MPIRPARLTDVRAIAHVHVKTWQASFRGVVPEDYLSELTEAESATLWERILAEPDNARFVLVAEGDAGQVVGFALGGPERQGDPVYTAELQGLYVLPSHQH